jgi:hypothetical protein
MAANMMGVGVVEMNELALDDSFRQSGHRGGEVLVEPLLLVGGHEAEEVSPRGGQLRFLHELAPFDFGLDWFRFSKD